MNQRIKNFPFNPNRSPFFYGWVILAFGTFGILMSVPGQTVGVSVFTDFLIEGLAIPRSYLSLAYMIGTIASALLMTRAGKLYDKYGARLMIVAVGIGLGAVLILFSFSDSIVGTLRSLFPRLPVVVVPMAVMSIAFFLVRFFGQGSLTLVSRNVVMEWFEKRRGFANAVLGVAISFGFSYAPRVLDALIGRFGWQNSYRVLALIVGGGFAFLAFLFMRSRPEDHGLKPDGPGRIKKREVHSETVASKEFTLPEARRTFVFWIMTFSLVMSALIVTAFTFHVISVFDSVGLSRETAVSIFLPSSFVAVAFQFFGSYASDYIKLKYVLLAQLVGLITLCVGVLILGRGAAIVLIIAGLGINQGLFGVTGNIGWARFFGRKHLGAVTGFAFAWIVAGSAVGPYLWSLSFEGTGSYAPAAAVALGILGFLFIAAFKAERPKVKQPEEEQPKAEQTGADAGKPEK
jgi:MFS family permease